MCAFRVFFQAITEWFFSITIYAHKYIPAAADQPHNVIRLVERCGLFHFAI